MSRECRNHKQGKRKVQGVPQSQAAVLPRHQEEEETDKTMGPDATLNTEIHKNSVRIKASNPINASSENIKIKLITMINKDECSCTSCSQSGRGKEKTNQHAQNHQNARKAHRPAPPQARCSQCLKD